MAGEAKIEKPTNPTNQDLKGDSSFVKLAEHYPTSGKDGGPSDSTSCLSSRDAAFSIKGNDADQEALANQGLYYQTNRCYGYYYPGYDGSYGQYDEQGYFGGDALEMPYSVPQQRPGYESTVLPKGYFPMGNFSSLYGHGTAGLLPQKGPANQRPNGQGWAGSDRYTMREKFNRNRQFNALNEQNLGPRANKGKGPWSSEENRQNAAIRNKYNLKDFQTKYDQAVFFVIKSYSEDDVHKSIKYSVWASTRSGNKKLDAAFHDAGARSSEKGSSCPVFLFFSVNGSGQFVGLAEMIGQVDFKKSMDFWQVDKWNGFFPVNWHIIKDIPNQTCLYIILENNENKPVTHSRDTQEIKFSQGIEMLNIFKNYPARTSILDDFGFYEDREKALHEKRNRPTLPHSQINNFQERQLEEAKKLETAKAKKTISDPKNSLTALTQNLTLNVRPVKNTARKDSTVG